ncbi:hypothetical protein VNO78_34920 [Psophocarpus tetragonolobus]|uniref:Uncharacterized protein n=1 Tax=Psophocarpus tetragonolobus TaxID=3891 RepID=A0AAN9RR90_PSOTE
MRVWTILEDKEGEYASSGMSQWDGETATWSNEDDDASIVALADECGQRSVNAKEGERSSSNAAVVEKPKHLITSLNAPQSRDNGCMNGYLGLEIDASRSRDNCRSGDIGNSFNALATLPSPDNMVDDILQGAIRPILEA